MIDIVKLQAAAASAAPWKPREVPQLPWHVEDDGDSKTIYSAELHTDNSGHHVSIASDLRAADANFIVTAVNALPELLAIADCAARWVRAIDAARADGRFTGPLTNYGDGSLSDLYVVVNHALLGKAGKVTP